MEVQVGISRKGGALYIDDGFYYEKGSKVGSRLYCSCGRTKSEHCVESHVRSGTVSISSIVISRKLAIPDKSGSRSPTILFDDASEVSLAIEPPQNPDTSELRIFKISAKHNHVNEDKRLMKDPAIANMKRAILT